MAERRTTRYYNSDGGRECRLRINTFYDHLVAIEEALEVADQDNDLDSIAQLNLLMTTLSSVVQLALFPYLQGEDKNGQT